MSDINENDENLEPEAKYQVELEFEGDGEPDPEVVAEAVRRAKQHAEKVVGLLADDASKQDDKAVNDVTPEAAEEVAEASADAEPASDVDDTAVAAPLSADGPVAPAADEPADGAPAPKSTVGLPVFVAAVVVAVIVGVLAGHFLLGSSSVALNGTTSISSDKLDSAIATYTYNGTTYEITTREVITASSSLDSAADSDGNYAVPSATDVLSYARNQIVLADADAQGVTVSDDEIDEYAESLTGSTDYATIASQYGIDEETCKEMFRSSAIMSKLRDTVCGTVSTTVPTAPTAPSDDATDTPTAEYASYIIALAGDEWDSANNTWASTDGDYYSALSTYQISNDSATYAAAQAAYYVAYSKYSTASSQVRSEFNTYCNELLSKATLQLGSLTL